MFQPIIGRFVDYKGAEHCVHDLIELGVSKDKISLIGRHAESYDADPHAIGVFRKNDDVNSQPGDIILGGFIGSIIGSLVGVATFTVPGIGLMFGAGPLVAGVWGGTIGGIFGANTEGLYPDANPLHAHVSSLKEEEILCGVEIGSDSPDRIREVMSKYAVSLNY